MATALGRAQGWVETRDLLDLVLIASAVSLVVTAHHDVTLMAITGLAALVVVRFSSIRWNPLTWILLGGGWLAWHLPAWFRYDNHVWLTAGWALALGLCLMTRSPARATAIEGRWFVVIIFGVGAMWKLGASDFRAGDFFHHALLNDDRFAVIASWLGGIAQQDLGPDGADLAGLVASPDQPVALKSNGRIRAVAWLFTVWGLVIEVAIALLWLLPVRRRFLWSRHASLLAFVGTTYLVVPVGGFGCLLMVLGLSQAGDDRRLRLAYVGAFLALLVYGPIWRVLLGP